MHNRNFAIRCWRFLQGCKAGISLKPTRSSTPLRRICRWQPKQWLLFGEVESYALERCSSVGTEGATGALTRRSYIQADSSRLRPAGRWRWWRRQLLRGVIWRASSIWSWIPRRISMRRPRILLPLSSNRRKLTMCWQSSMRWQNARKRSLNNSRIRSRPSRIVGSKRCYAVKLKNCSAS